MQRIAVERQLALLPQALSYQVRTTSLPLSLRSIFAHIPAPLALEVEVGSRCERLPLTARQLLKAAMVGDGLQPVTIQLHNSPPHDSALSLTLSRPPTHRLQLTQTQLHAGLQPLLATMIEQLYEAEHFSSLLQRFAFNSALLSSLRLFAIQMLRVRTLSEVQYLLLSGLTSGLSLGFNRAAIFTPIDPADPSRGFNGACAIGEIHTPEAFRIWERLEFAEHPLEDLLEHSPLSAQGTPFDRLVRRTTLSVDDHPEDELRAASSRGRPLRFSSTNIENASLRALSLRSPFALAPLRGSHNRLLGLVFADNCHNRSPIHDEHLYYLAIFLGQAALIWENIELSQKIEHQARHDHLTGALNRLGFEEHFASAVARSQHRNEPLSILAFDLDNFKRINDEKGHEAGDQVLRTLTQIVLRRLGAGDSLARFGGDEFIALLLNSDASAAASKAEEIGRDAYHAGILLSVGSSTWPDDLPDPSRLLSIADQRLYAAKRDGGARAHLSNQSPRPFSGLHPTPK
jgi:diguanylate cyclase (GGDEF)-like protein